MTTAVLIEIGILIVSLAVLLKCSDLFVDNAEHIGLALGVSSFIIGVTIVALGTSLPELATSIASVIYDKSEVVIGNVVGSNITNILLVLGLTAFVGKKIMIKPGVIKSELPYLFLSSIVFAFIVYDQKVNVFECLVLLILLVVYLIQTLANDDEKTLKEDRPKIKWIHPLLVLVGGVGIYLGADYTIKSLINISEIFNINTGLLALSLVALGTSLPEVAVSLSAIKKGKGDIALGNVIGSNIFNTYGVLGLSALFGTLVIPAEILEFSVPFMVAITLALFLLGQGKIIDRWGGASLIIVYIFFLIQLFS